MVSMSLSHTFLMTSSWRHHALDPGPGICHPVSWLRINQVIHPLDGQERKKAGGKPRVSSSAMWTHITWHKHNLLRLRFKQWMVAFSFLPKTGVLLPKWWGCLGSRPSSWNRCWFTCHNSRRLEKQFLPNMPFLIQATTLSQWQESSFWPEA